MKGLKYVLGERKMISPEAPKILESVPNFKLMCFDRNTNRASIPTKRMNSKK